MNTYKPNIDNYFEEARRQEPVFSFNEARTLLESGSVAHAKIYNINRAIKPLNVILTTVAAAAAVGIIMFTTGNFNNHNPQNEVTKPSIAMQSGVTQEQTNKPLEKPAEKSSTIKEEVTSKLKTFAGVNAKVEENVDNNIIPVKPSKRIDVKGINMIELTSEELCDLGINTDNDGSGYLRFWSNGKQQPQQCELHVNSGLGLIDTWDEDTETKTIKTFPKVITDNAGNQRYCLLNDRDAIKLRATCIPSNNGIRNNFNSGLTIASSSKISNQENKKPNNLYQIDSKVGELMRINKLIAVKVPMGVKIPKELLNSNTKMSPNDEFSFILWFDPTPEFISKLPKRIKDRLRPELQALEKNPEGICNANAVAGEKTYFDVWRACSGAIEKLSVYPNPARDKISIGFVLKKERNFNIYLHTLTGERIGQLLKNGHHSSGLWEGNFQLQNINPGMYLVVIESDKGEQVVQRVIVE